MRYAWICSFFVAACGPSLIVPRSAVGDVSLRIVNDSPRDICVFRMGPPDHVGDSWIDAHHMLPLGTTQTVEVRQGPYAVAAESCDRTYRAGIDHVDIAGPTDISIGGQGGPSSGVQQVALHREAPAPPPGP